MRHLLACALLFALLAGCGGTTTTSSGTATGDAAAASDGKADATATDAGADSAGKTDTSTAKDTTPAACNPLANTGCKDPGTHCGYDDTETVACIADGSHAVGEACGDGQGCKVGMCVTAQNGKSACAPYCATDAGCDSGSCNKIEGKKYKTCDVATYEPCDPTQQDCKTAGQACYDLGSSGFGCAKAGTADHGDTCAGPTDCQKGYTCTGTSGGLGNGICRKFCHVTPPTGCDDPTTACAKITSSIGYCGE